METSIFSQEGGDKSGSFLQQIEGLKGHERRSKIAVQTVRPRQEREFRKK